MTGVCIYTLREKLSLTQLSSAISKMREDVRLKHTDIRANGKVVKTMQTFLDKIQPSTLKSDPSDKTSAATTLRSLQDDEPRTKRKREDDTDEEEPKKSSVSKPSKVLKKSKVEPKPSSSSRSTNHRGGGSGSKIIVKKVMVSTPKKVSAPPVRGSAMESLASEVSHPKSKHPQRSQSTSTSTSPQPPPSSPSATSLSDTPATSNALFTQPSAWAPPRKESEEILSSSITRRPVTGSVQQNTHMPEASVEIVQQITIKSDPDGARPSQSVLDRLAVIRNAKISPERSIVSPTATISAHASFAAQQERLLEQIPMPVVAGPSSQPDLLPLQLQPATGNSILDNGENADRMQVDTPTSVNPLITTAQVHSILAKAGFLQQPPDRRNSVDVVPRASTDADMGVRDPRRRLSTSPNQTFFSPGFTSGVLSVGRTITQGNPQLSPTAGPSWANAQPRSASAPSVDARQAPSGPLTQASPEASSSEQPPPSSLPRKPDVLPKIGSISTDMLAVQINPHRRSPEIPKGPRADRMREQEWGRGGHHGGDGMKRSRWDTREPYDARERDRGWGGGGSGQFRDSEYGWRS